MSNVERKKVYIKKKYFDKLPLPMMTFCQYLYNNFNYLKEKDTF